MMDLIKQTFELLTKGGIVIVPLFLFSVIALGITIDRSIRLRIRHVVPEEFLKRVRNTISDGRIADAIALCSSQRASIAHVLYAGLSKIASSRSEVEKAMESAGRSEHANLSRGLPFLGIVAGVSPLLGLLGTVIGMIKTFTVIQMQGLANTENLAGGISEALISTAAGMTVAIPYFIAAKYFAARVDSLTMQLEEEAHDFLTLLSIHSGQRSEPPSPEAAKVP